MNIKSLTNIAVKNFKITININHNKVKIEEKDIIHIYNSVLNFKKKKNSK